MTDGELDALIAELRGAYAPGQRRRAADALATYRTREQQARALLAERRRGNEQRADDFGGLLRDLEAIYAKEAAS